MEVVFLERLQEVLAGSGENPVQRAKA